MMTTASKVIAALAGKMLVTAESLTGGGIGGVLTSVPGASKVFKGGVISYTDEIKRDVLIHKITNSSIFFKGFREQGNVNIKGLEGIDILWIFK